jgi:RNA polymerase sigma-70 factor, ECF subfamily
MSATLALDLGSHAHRRRLPTIELVPDDRSDDDDPASRAFALAAAGDQRAFAEFYDRVAPLVFGVVLRVLRDRAQAEEVTQEVFIELWRTAPRFDRERGSVRTWAVTIAHRRAVDRVRSEQSARKREVADAARIRVPHDEVAEQAADSIDREEVADAMRELSDVQRDAVALAFYGGLTYREVASRLSIPEGTAKTRIRDGLSKLRDLMGGSHE